MPVLQGDHILGLRLRLVGEGLPGVKGDGNREGGALAQGALYHDLAAHPDYQVLDDGHTQSGACHLLGPKANLPLVGVKEFGKKFLRHAGAGILHDEQVVVPLALVHLPQRDRDAVPLPGKFHGVGDQVVDDLAQPGGIALNHPVCYVDGQPEILSLVLGLGLEGGETGLQILHQVEGFNLHGDIALLQAGNLQNVVNQGQKLLAGRPDLVQVAHHLLPVAVVLEGQAGHADDNVQRGTHIVAHDGEELLLRLFALLRGGQGALQQADLPLLLLLFVLHIPEADDHLIGDFFRIGEHTHADPALIIPELLQKLAAKIPGAMLHQLPDIFQGEVLEKILRGPLIQSGSDHVQQLAIVAGFARHPLPNIVRGFCHLKDACQHINTVKGVINIAHNLYCLVDPLGCAAQLAVPQPHANGNHQEEHQCNAIVYQNALNSLEQGLIGDGQNAEPSIIGMLVIETAGQLLHTDNCIVLAVQLAVADPVKQVFGIDLEILFRRLEGDTVIQQTALAVQHIVGAARWQVLHSMIGMEMIQGHIQRNRVVAPGGGDGNGNHHLAIIRVTGIGVGINHLAFRSHGLLIPKLSSVVVILAPQPASGDNPSVQHSIDIQAAGADEGSALFKEIHQPGFKFRQAHPLVIHILQVIHGHCKNAVIFT